MFSLNKNMLYFRVAFPGTAGPRLTLYNEFFNYRFPIFPGGFPDPAPEVLIQAPAVKSLTINWFAEPWVGTYLTGFRWSLDNQDLSDETPRRNQNDLKHWSEWSIVTTSATLKFSDEDLLVDHRLYVEVRDNVGFISLAILRIHFVVPTLEKSLLIVDDTRFRPDRRALDGSLAPPIGAWPTAAELDSFLYARGGFPWQGYPAGTLSQTGIFNGYEFDTLGTRTGRFDLTVPLDVLSRYRQVIWLVDGLGATFNRQGNDPFEPMTALRYMSSPGRENTLAAYIEQGGKVWMAGGGAGFASTIEWDHFSNNTPTIVFSSLGPRQELAPGRMMYDQVHWRSEFRVTKTAPQTIEKSPSAIGGQHSPDYGLFPSVLELRTSATDPVPPLRNAAVFYLTELILEFLQRPNPILEDRVPSDPVTKLVSALDTIYTVSGSSLPPAAPVMTYYHGFENGPVLFTGFDLWSFRRTQCAALVDAVLQGIWKLPRNGSAALTADDQPIRRGTWSRRR